MFGKRFPGFDSASSVWGNKSSSPVLFRQSVTEEEHGQWLWVAVTRKAQKSSLRPN
jgi:hypothetical protein